MSDDVFDTYRDVLRPVDGPEQARKHLSSHWHHGYSGEPVDAVAEHDADHRDRAGLLDHVHEPPLPPPPTGPEVVEFIKGLDGATSWPEPPATPGVDEPYGMRTIRADQLQAGDILHYRDSAVEVVEVSHPIVPLVLRRIAGRAAFPLTPGASKLVLASRPSGWGDEQAPVAPDLGGLGPSRAEILAGIRRPHHDTDAEEADADGR